MNKVLLILLLFLSGCTQSIDVETYSKAVKMCENNGGLKRIVVYAPSIYKFECNNGMSN
jgi:Tfp pilus assembly protein PilP